MRRVTFLITMGIDRPSGQRYFNLARELARHGDRVRILALHPDLARCPQRRFVQDGVEVWYVGQMHSHKRDGVTLPMSPLRLLRVLLAATLGMIWGVLCSPAEVYHLGKPQPVNGLAALIAVVGLRRRGFWVDCDDDEVTSNRLTSSWQRAVFAFWQWLLPALASGVSVNTRFLAERMRQRGIRPVAYVPNGVDLAVFQPPAPPVLAALRSSLGLDGATVVAYFGTIAFHNHPVDLLLEAFRLPPLADPAVRLLLVGGGEDLPAARAWISEHGMAERIICTGHVPRAAVPAYVGLAALTVDPVEDNAVARARSPLKLFESMALGLPVVTGAVGDRPELLGDAGVAIAAETPAALAEAIHALLANPAERARLAENALAQARRYTWQTLALHLMRGYESR